MKLERIEEGKRLLNRLILLLFGVLTVVNLYGYKLQVDGFDVDARDLSARTEPRYDLNERMCALIKIELPEGAKFEGNVVDFKHDVNEYWVYVSPGTKFLKIKYPGFETLSLSFPELGVADGLDSGVTYLLSLSGYRDNRVSVPQDPGANWLILDITPKTGVTVKIDGQVEKVENGQTMTYLKYGSHDYSVEASGYDPQSGTVNIVRGDKITVPVRLSSIMGSLSITTGTSGASIMVNGEKKGTDSWEGELNPGLYRIEVTKGGYETYSRNVEIAKNESKDIKIPSLNPVYATLNIAYRPIGSEVLLDGKPVGTTPLVLNDVTAADHTVTIRKAGYQPVKKNIVLKTNQLEELTGQLTEEIAVAKLSRQANVAQIVKEMVSAYDKKDYEKAYELAMSISDNPRAQNYLGYMYDHGLGVKQDYAEAVKWYRKGAEGGNTSAMGNLGYMYKNGLGVKQDYSEALKWYRKGAEGGNATAMRNLGGMYQNGLGIKQDYAEALKWYRKAVEGGNARAMNNLGYMYYNGLGVKQDYAEALKWYRKGAEGGNATAMYSIGFMYENGYGVNQDYAEALRWYLKSADKGDEDAEAKVKELEKKVK